MISKLLSWQPILILIILASLLIPFQNCAFREQFKSSYEPTPNEFQADAVNTTENQSVHLSIPIEEIQSKIESSDPGSLNLKVEWTHINNQGQSRLLEANGTNLIIEPTRSEDEGTYQAVVFANDEEFSFTFKVRIIESLAENSPILPYVRFEIDVNNAPKNQSEFLDMTYAEALEDCNLFEANRNGEGIECRYGGLVFLKRGNDNRTSQYVFSIFDNNGDPQFNRSLDDIKKADAILACEADRDANDNEDVECRWDGQVIFSD